MLKEFIFSFFLIFLLSIHDGWAVVNSFPSNEAISKVKETYGKLPLYFIENNGQVDKKVTYYEKGNNHSIFFTKKGVYLQLQGAKDRGQGAGGKRELNAKTKTQVLKTEIIKLIPLNANKNPEIIAEGIQGGKVNYFIGSNKSKWKTNVSTYSAVLYKEVYKGIDIKYYGNNQQLEYDIIVKPGATPNKVKFSYKGIEGLKVTEEGNLEIALKEGKIIQKKPYIYQDIDGTRVEVDGSFKVFNSPLTTESPLSPPLSKGDTGGFTYSFQVASYNKNHPLIIDPILSYSTYLGGSSGDVGNGIAVDASGNVYITGSTNSTDFPLAKPIDGTFNGGDIFITKIDSSGSALVYSTYLGGSSADVGNGIAVDASGNVYITGSTDSTDFPLAKPIDKTFNKGDAFITKIDSSGSTLIYSTYLGGSDYDYASDIAVDASRNTYITGYTSSTDFPLVKPIKGTYSGGVYDAFVTKINPSGSAFVYSTYLGGSNYDVGYDIAVDTSGNAYITGSTSSSDFPLAKPINGTYNEFGDAFITKINSSGSALVYSTYLGGDSSDVANGIAVDTSGNTYITGYTESSNFPLVTPIDGTFDGYGYNEAFVTKIDPAGANFIYSTYLGGSGEDIGNSIAVDTLGNAYITGMTSSSDFLLANQIKETLNGSYNIFITKIDPSGLNIAYSTYISGNNYDSGNSIAVDVSGNAYITGSTGSTNFPLAKPIDGTLNGSYDAFVTKIDSAQYTLIVTKTGEGFGTITSLPTSINCDVDCLKPYISGAIVTLTAIPDTKSFFAGWNGDADCSDGVVTMNRDKTCTATFIPDTAPPTGTIVINAGTVWTNTISITLTLTCTDNTNGTGCANMQITNDGVFDTEQWEAFITNKAWQLTTGDDSKTVSIRYQDGAGNISATYTNNITLDTTKPVISAVSDTPDPFKPSVKEEKKIVEFTLADNLSGMCMTIVRVSTQTGIVVRNITKNTPCPSTGIVNFIIWDGKNSTGNIVPAGTYIYDVISVDKAMNRFIVQRGTVNVI